MHVAVHTIRLICSCCTIERDRLDDQRPEPDECASIVPPFRIGSRHISDDASEYGLQVITGFQFRLQTENMLCRRSFATLQLHIYQFVQMQDWPGGSLRKP